MDGQKNKDNSNFFSRIKNVDVLRSPYPRHLVSGGRGTNAAAGTRAPPANTTSHYGTARPAPVLPAPLWQSPVPRHSDFAISPTHVVSRFGVAGQIGAPQIPPYLPPPAEYPSSVQPLRSRPRSFPDQRFAMPGSTLPTHLRSGNALRSISSNTQICVLHRWFASVDIDKRTVTVSGSFTKPSGKTVLRHSTPIEQAHDNRILIASTGTIYQLASAADFELMRANGFPENLLPHFVDGFPRDWRQLVDRYIVSATGIGHRTGSSIRRNDGILRAGFPPLQRRESYDNSHRRLSSERINAIAESDEDLYEPRPPLSPSSFNNGNSVGTYQARISEASTSPGYRGSVYRTGADIFALGRFAQTSSRHSSDTIDIASSSTVGGPAYLEANEDADDTFNVLDKYESEEDVDKESAPYDDETPSHQSLGEQDKDEQDDDLSTQGTDEGTVIKLGGVLDGMRVERDLSSEPNGDPVSNTTAAIITKNQQQRQQQQAEGNSDVDGKENEASIEKCSSALKETVKDTLKRKPRGAKRQQSLQSKGSARRVVETSDESCQLSAEGISDDDSDNEPLSVRKVLSTANRTQFNSRRISGQRPATVTRSTRRATLLETPTKSVLNPKAPSSAPSDRVKGNKTGTSGKSLIERRQGRGANGGENINTTKSKDAKDSDSDFASEPCSKPAPKDRHGDAGSASQGEESDKDSSSVKASSELNTPSKGSKDNGLTDLNKTPLDPSMTTPKRRKGRNYFRYTELPGPSISVTRSGRKVRRPNDWWANAQEHLSTGHKESDIKYKWGTGDPVLVKGSKRVKLSDYYMQGGGADLHADDQISEPACQNSDESPATTSFKALDDLEHV